MPIDPATVAASAVVSVGTQIARVVWDNTGQRALNRRYAAAADGAKAKAERNARDFGGRLGRVLARGGRSDSDPVSAQTVEDRLTDPDVALTVEEGFLSAARTSDPGRHETIARLLAGRITAATDSPKAVAATQAVDVIKSLATPHLNLLGLLAFVYGVRPPGGFPSIADFDKNDADPSGADPPRHVNERFAEWLEQNGESYRRWLDERLQAHRIDGDIGESSYAQLAASSCIVVVRGLRRHLRKTLRTLPGERYDATYGERRPISHAIATVMDGTDGGRSLTWHWRHGLQEVTLTPAGLLIGLAVHDVKTGDEQALIWEWSRGAELPNEVEGDAIWDGRDVTDEFAAALARNIKDALFWRRRPWSEVFEDFRNK